MTAVAYDDGEVVLYCGDNLAAPDLWTGADVLVTDPPYGRGWRQGDLGALHGWADDSHAGIVGDDDTAARDAVLALWGDRPAVVFGDLMLGPPAGTRQVLIYRKAPNAGTRGATAGYRRDVEAVYLVGKWPTGLGGSTSILTTGARTQSSPWGLTGRYGHPHAKPVDLLEDLIARLVPVGQTVADPFAGSGSTLVAARNQGRRAVGVEVDPGYVATAAARLAQAVLV